MLSPAKRQRIERAERVELFLGGVWRKSEVQSFLRKIARIDELGGIVSVACSGSCGRATLTGPRAGLSARSALGQRAEANRPLAEVKLHNDWWCPCGQSGEAPINHLRQCPNCQQMKPSSLLDALASSSGAGVGRAAPQGSP
eukprot:1883754-Prymnesium_polylepis.1